MNRLNHELSLKEKLVVIGLTVILLGLLYYKFVDQPMKAQIETLNTEISDITDEKDIIQTKVMYYSNMQSNLDVIKGLDIVTYMPSYNANKEEVAFLNNVLSNADSYSINFSEVTRNSNQIRRKFNITFAVQKYEEASKIIETLSNGDVRCMIGDISCTKVDAKSYGDQHLYDSYISMTVSATFYETLVGGRVDSALPKDADIKEKLSEDDE